MIEKRVHKKDWLYLTGFLCFSLAAYTWLLPFRDLYGMEIRNALMAREMLENGLSMIPKVWGRPYPDYLPLYFWLTVLFSTPTGSISTFSAVFPSALSAVGLIALTFCLGRRISPRVGWLSALILATIPTFWMEAGHAVMDMLLAFCVTAAILCFYFRDVKNNPLAKDVFVMGAYFSLLAAFMVKGPIGIVLPSVSWGGYLLLNKRWKDLVSFSVCMMLAGLLCTGVELSIAYAIGGEALAYGILRMQVFGRLQDAARPFYYYFITLLGIGSLWWLLIIACFCVLVKQGRAKQEISKLYKLLLVNSETRLALSWFVGIFTVFSLAASKHTRYLLPLYPAAAVILAAWVDHFFIDNSHFSTTRLQNILLALSIALLSAGIAFYTLLDRIRFVPFGCMMIWLAAGAAGIALVDGWIKPRHRLTGSALLLLAVGLSGTTLLVTPAMSRRASLHAFVTAVESRIDPQLPLIFYGLDRDGDALQYIYYSDQKQAEIHFVDGMEKLNRSLESCVLITPFTEKVRNMSDWNTRKVAEGQIRSKRFYAYFLRSKQTSSG